MAIINASIDMTVSEEPMRLVYVEPHDSITEGYYRLQFENITVYLSKPQVDALGVLCKEGGEA